MKKKKTKKTVEKISKFLLLNMKLVKNCHCFSVFFENNNILYNKYSNHKRKTYITLDMMTLEMYFYFSRVTAEL